VTSDLSCLAFFCSSLGAAKIDAAKSPQVMDSIPKVPTPYQLHEEGATAEEEMAQCEFESVTQKWNRVLPSCGNRDLHWSDFRSWGREPLSRRPFGTHLMS